jgi:hypothetical protein
MFRFIGKKRILMEEKKLKSINKNLFNSLTVEEIILDKICYPPECEEREELESKELFKKREAQLFKEFQSAYSKYHEEEIPIDHVKAKQSIRRYGFF